MLNISKRVSILVAAITVATSTPALAGKLLATPFVNVPLTQNILCSVTNVGTSDAEIAIAGIDATGADAGGILGTCPVPPAALAAGTSCILILSAGTDAYCRVTGKGKLRASLQVYGPSGETQVAIPATAK